MPNTNVTIRIDADLKKQADKLFDEMGLSFTAAVNVFVKQSLREQRIPFEISMKPTYGYSISDLESGETHHGDE